MKKRTKQKIFKVTMVVAAAVFLFGGAGGSIYYLWANARAQKAYEEYYQQMLDEYMAELAAAEATLSATPAAEILEQLE